MGCSHDCSSCASNCKGKDGQSENMKVELNAHSNVKRVIGIISGKGGVGKSLVTSLLAVSMQRKGFEVAVMDADITGPSIPKMFGLKDKAVGTEDGLYPVKTKTGIDVMSINLLLEDETDPVVWRGPVIGGAITQFWTDVIWGSKDFMFVDMPPGTGDVALTVFQSLPVDGIIVVTSPQDLVSMIVGKAVKMARLMNIPIIGLVENMSYIKCPDCGKEIPVFGESHLSDVAASYGLEVLGRIPLDQKLSGASDKGVIELADTTPVEDAAGKIEKML